jgi:DNA invertase Pin-like site-specific DNA recombinase
MSHTLVVPAAQYLRMSTEQQHFSLDYQAAAIHQYADSNGFTIVRSYEDPGRSGLLLKHRKGLAQLLHDVLSGSQTFHAVLVYDVSRWGRFQDTDEAAHYEFICKSAGIPVHYCAETFDNDGSPPAAIMKTLKRVMAAEYSRELSVRIIRTKTIMTERGFRVGGVAGYGLRRMLIALDGSPRQILAPGDVKGVASGRVILVPGPRKEVELVRRIYRWFVSDGRSATSIARELNSRGIEPCVHTWDAKRILEILTNPKYVGMAAWRRTTGPLGCKRTKVAQELWVAKSNAFTPIVEQKTFDAAQVVIRHYTVHQSNDDLLCALKGLLKKKGRLSQHIINSSEGVPTSSTYIHRFGSVKQAYDLIGYGGFRNISAFLRMRHRHDKLRQSLLTKILRLFPGEVRLVAAGNEHVKHRRMLCFSDGLKVAVQICQYVDADPWHVLWRLRVYPHEQCFVTLICRCNANNTGFKDFYVLPHLDAPTRCRVKNSPKRQFHIREYDPLLKSGKRLTDLSKLKRLADCFVTGREKGLNPNTLPNGLR